MKQPTSCTLPSRISRDDGLRRVIIPFRRQFSVVSDTIFLDLDKSTDFAPIYCRSNMVQVSLIKECSSLEFVGYGVVQSYDYIKQFK